LRRRLGFADFRKGGRESSIPLQTRLLQWDTSCQTLELPFAVLGSGRQHHHAWWWWWCFEGGSDPSLSIAAFPSHPQDQSSKPWSSERAALTLERPGKCKQRERSTREEALRQEELQILVVQPAADGC
jgi:hypothetical protein